MIEHWKDRRAEQQKLLDWLGRDTAVVTKELRARPRRY